jgi:hypothetical protein
MLKMAVPPMNCRIGISMMRCIARKKANTAIPTAVKAKNHNIKLLLFDKYQPENSLLDIFVRAAAGFSAGICLLPAK